MIRKTWREFEKVFERMLDDAKFQRKHGKSGEEFQRDIPNLQEPIPRSLFKHIFHIELKHKHR